MLADHSSVEGCEAIGQRRSMTKDDGRHHIPMRQGSARNSAITENRSCPVGEVDGRAQITPVRRGTDGVPADRDWRITAEMRALARAGADSRSCHAAWSWWSAHYLQVASMPGRREVLDLGQPGRRMAAFDLGVARHRDDQVFMHPLGPVARRHRGRRRQASSVPGAARTVPMVSQTSCLTWQLCCMQPPYRPGSA